jgi:hypothetical protein
MQVQKVGNSKLEPLHWSEKVGAQLQQLHYTRTLADRITIGVPLGTQLAVGETAHAMDGEDALGHESPHTQFAFGTQVARPIHSRQTEDEPHFLGINRMEPVLAGATQREELRPDPAKEKYEQRAKLLDLLRVPNLRSVGKPQAPQSSKTACVTTLSKNDQKTVEPTSAQPLLTQLPSPRNRQQKPKHVELETAALVSPEAARVTKQVKEVDHAPLSMNVVEDEPSNIEHPAKGGDDDELQSLVSQCSWMKGFEFSRDALKVDSAQLSILQKEESWHKPQPGYNFPVGNVPMTILTNLYRIADENAAMDAGPDSDDEMDEDPSPESVVEKLTPSQEPVLPPTQNDQLQSSPFSWAASPTPEPPNLSRQPGRSLPPDSSVEIPDAGTNEVRTVDAGSDFLPQPPIIINSSNEKEPSLPPSSPPSAQHIIDSDEDMEMEACVPQALGEDSTEGAMEDQMRLPSSEPPRPTSVVQVKETPYAKSKQCHTAVAVGLHQAQIQESTNTSNHTSSTSIVPGTYNNATSSSYTKNLFRPEVTTVAIDKTVEITSSRSKHHEGQGTLTSGPQNSKKTALHIDMEDEREVQLTVSEQEAMPEGQLAGRSTVDVFMASPREAEQASVVVQLPSSIPGSPELVAVGKIESPSAPELLKNNSGSKSPSLRPGSAKRKLENSPSKKSGRQSKRRELKIVSFGNGPIPIDDSVSALRQYLEESKRTFREERKSGMSVSGRPSSITKPSPDQDVTAMDVDSPSMPAEQALVPPMSPRHQSLYEDPSPRITVPTAVLTLTPITNGLINDEQTLTPLAEDRPRAEMPAKQQVEQQNKTPAAININNNRKVFDIFRTAYPEYTGDVKHFQGQCTQMLTLEKEDKMVPKWQWDDYIIRNRTDYKDYALDCVDRGENPEPYYRFYKDNIDNTIYNKGVVKSVGTLTQAVSELGILLPASKSTVQQFPHLQPANRAVRTPKLAPDTRSTPKPDISSRLRLHGATSPEIPDSSGDEFKDAVYAFQRLTSLTGSKKVSHRPRDRSGRKS